MIKPIYTYGEEILTEKSINVDLNDTDTQKIIQDLFDTLKEAPMGVGLSAPQIGINKNIFVIDIGDDDDENIDGVFINPKILQEGGYIYQTNECCLSLPGIILGIKRPTIIELEWYDRNLQHHKQFFIDIQSRIIQHEMDHLNGKLIIDRADPDDVNKHINYLDDIKKKKIKTNYFIYDGK